MPISLLEVQRVRRMLEDFCARRNATATRHGARLRCRQKGDSLLIEEADPLDSVNDSGRFQARVRVSYKSGRWYLFWSQGGGDWRPYAHLPEVDSIQAVIDELEQAPLHVHWG